MTHTLKIDDQYLCVLSVYMSTECALIRRDKDVLSEDLTCSVGKLFLKNDIFLSTWRFCYCGNILCLQCWH